MPLQKPSKLPHTSPKRKRGITTAAHKPEAQARDYDNHNEKTMATTNSTGSYLFPSDLGWMALAWSGNRLTRLTFGHPSAASAIASLEADDAWIETFIDDAPPWIADL